MVDEPEGLSADPDSVLVISGPVDPSLVRAAAALSGARRRSTSRPRRTSGRSAPSRGSRWTGPSGSATLPLLVLVPGSSHGLTPDVLEPISRLLRDHRSQEDALDLERRALEADRARHADRSAARRPSRSGSRPRPVGSRSGRARPSGAADAPRRRWPGSVDPRGPDGCGAGTAPPPDPRRDGRHPVLAVLVLVGLVAGVWLVARTGHAGLAVLGVAGVVVGVGTALLVLRESTHGRPASTRAPTDDDGGSASCAAARSRSGTGSRSWDAKHDDVVGRLGRIELMLAHRDPARVDPPVRTERRRLAGPVRAADGGATLSG